MRDPVLRRVAARGRALNTVTLQNAVLCIECDVVSDSPHDTCLVCGSRSLLNIARVFGGQLPKERASLIARQEIATREVVLAFSKAHRTRRKAAVDLRQSIAFDDREVDEVERAV